MRIREIFFVLLGSVIATQCLSKENSTTGLWHSSLIGGGGYIMDIIPTKNPQLYYLHTDVGGMYRSDDGGGNWKMIHGGLPSRLGTQEPKDIVVNPRDPKHILVTVGSHWEKSPDGIYVSKDAGTTYRKTLTATFAGNGEDRMYGRTLAIDPSNPKIVITASLKDGIFRSEDFGETWTHAGLKNLNPIGLHFDKANPNRLLLLAKDYTNPLHGVANPNFKGGYFESLDKGKTWREIKIESYPLEIQQLPTPAASEWIGVFPHATLMKSTDGGITWKNYSQGLPKFDEQNPMYVTALEIAADFVLIGDGNGILYTRKFNDSQWETIEPKAKAPATWYGNDGSKPGWKHFGKAISTLKIDPHNGDWWLCDWYMIWRSSDQGRNWVYAGNGLEVTVIHNFAQIPDSPNVVLMGMADNGFFRSIDQGKSYQQNWDVITNNIKDISVSLADNSRAYAIGPDKNGHWFSNTVFISNDRGLTWSKTESKGLPTTSGSESRINSITLDPKDKNVVYVALSGEVNQDGGIYRSADAGKSWKKYSEGLPQNSLFRSEIWYVGREVAASADKSLVAISADTTQVFYFSPADKVWKTSTQPFGKVNSVVSAPQTKGRYLLASPQSGLHESLDGGKSWKVINKAPCYHVVFDLTNESRVAIGTEDGIQLSNDSGKTWRTLDKKLPNRRSNTLAFIGERLVVGTSGSGAFWYDLKQE